MVAEKIRKNKIIKFLTNKYIIILAAFLVWMFFFDANVQLNKEFQKEIKELNNTINFYKKEIKQDKKIITELFYLNIIQLFLLYFSGLFRREFY